MSTTSARDARSGLPGRMIAINIAAILTMAIHDADHVRQAIDMHYRIPVHVAAILLAAYLPLVASICWARTGHLKWATAATELVIGGVLVLLSFVHLAGVQQVWAPLGDVFGMWGMSYWQMNVDAISWAAFVLLAVSYAGLLAATLKLRREASLAAVTLIARGWLISLRRNAR